MSPQCAVPARPQPPAWHGTLSSASRKITAGAWSRIAPGFEGRLIVQEHGLAWIDIRPEHSQAAEPLTLFDDEPGGEPVGEAQR